MATPTTSSDHLAVKTDLPPAHTKVVTPVDFPVGMYSSGFGKALFDLPDTDLVETEDGSITVHQALKTQPLSRQYWDRLFSKEAAQFALALTANPSKKLRDTRIYELTEEDASILVRVERWLKLAETDMTAFEKEINSFHLEIIRGMKETTSDVLNRFFCIDSRTRALLQTSAEEIVKDVKAMRRLFNHYEILHGITDPETVAEDIGLTLVSKALPSSYTEELTKNLVEVTILENSFKSSYVQVNNSLYRFLREVRHLSLLWRRENFGAPYILFAQSSGFGKTRLITECGRLTPVMFVCFRRPGSSGFPGRSAIADWLTVDVVGVLKANGFLESANINLASVVIAYYVAFLTACIRILRM